MPLKRRDLERVIDDCYNDDEAATAFCVVIDEHLADGPVAARLAGLDITCVGVSYRNERRGITANIRRDGHTCEVALFDVSLDEAGTPSAKAISRQRQRSSASRLS